MPVARRVSRLAGGPGLHRDTIPQAPGSSISGAPREPTGTADHAFGVAAGSACRSARPTFRRHTAGPRALRRIAATVCLAATFGVLGAPGLPAIAAPPMSASGAERDHPFAIQVHEAASRFGLPEAWLIAVMRVESAGNPRARSAVGAIGLMQVMPATWSELAARHQLGTDPWDARANVLAGAAYLREMVERYGDLETALAAYNAGPARADAWRRNARALPTETVHYVAKVLHLLGRQAVPGTAKVPTAAVRPDWQHSPLFTARAGAEPAEAPIPIGTVPLANAPAPVVEPWSTSTTALPADRLFVGRSPASR